MDSCWLNGWVIVSASRHPPTLFICLGVRLTEMRDSKGSVDEFANSVRLNISKGIHVRYIKRLNAIWTSDDLTKTNKKRCQNSVEFLSTNHEKSSHIDPKSFQNRPERHQNRWRCVLGAFSVPNRAKVGSRTLRPATPGNGNSRFWLKMTHQT